MKALKALIFILFFCNGLSTSTARECQTNAETIVLTSYPIKPKLQWRHCSCQCHYHQ